MTSHQIIDAIIYPICDENITVAILLFLGCVIAAAGLAIAFYDLICWLGRGAWIVVSEVWGVVKGKGGHF